MLFCPLNLVLKVSEKPRNKLIRLVLKIGVSRVFRKFQQKRIKSSTPNVSKLRTLNDKEGVIQLVISFN